MYLATIRYYYWGLFNHKKYNKITLFLPELNVFLFQELSRLSLRRTSSRRLMLIPRLRPWRLTLVKSSNKKRLLRLSHNNSALLGFHWKRFFFVYLFTLRQIVISNYNGGHNCECPLRIGKTGNLDTYLWPPLCVQVWHQIPNNNEI